MIFEAPKANWKLRFASKSLLASDFGTLEISGIPKSDQEGFKEVSKSSEVKIPLGGSMAHRPIDSLADRLVE